MTMPTILITGGTGKFGRRYVEHFSQKGWTVVFTSTSQERAQTFEKEASKSANVYGIAVDLMEPDGVKSLLGGMRSLGLQINHLVNNARSLAFLKVSEGGVTNREDFMSEYLMDVVVPYELSISLWREQPDALKTVTNISSQYGIVAANPTLYENHASQSPIQYSVAKAALNQLTRELAVRMARDEIRVNAVAYGGVEGRVDDEFKSRYGAMVPNGRMLDETELAGAVDFLVSEKSSAMTGQVLQVDGGWTIW